MERGRRTWVRRVIKRVVRDRQRLWWGVNVLLAEVEDGVVPETAVIKDKEDCEEPRESSGFGNGPIEDCRVRRSMALSASWRTLSHARRYRRSQRGNSLSTRDAMKSPAVLHMTWTASQAVVMTYVSSLASNSSDRRSARSADAVGLLSLIMRVLEDGLSLAGDGKLILETTEGQRSFMRGKKLFSFCARTGNICTMIERRERRRYGEGEER